MKFQGVVELGGRTATGIEIPAPVIEELDAGKRAPVVISLGSHAYRTTLAVMGGRYLVPLSAENRTAAGVAAGDEVEVEVTLDAEPRIVEVPDDLVAALDSEPGGRAAFDALAPTPFGPSGPCKARQAHLPCACSRRWTSPSRGSRDALDRRARSSPHRGGCANAARRWNWSTNARRWCRRSTESYRSGPGLSEQLLRSVDPIPGRNAICEPSPGVAADHLIKRLIDCVLEPCSAQYRLGSGESALVNLNGCASGHGTSTAMRRHEICTRGVAQCSNRSGKPRVTL